MSCQSQTSALATPAVKVRKAPTALELLVGLGLDLAAAQHLLPLCEVRDVTRGHRLFVQGEPSTGLYLLMEGALVCLDEGPGRRARRLSQLEPGAVLGEALLMGTPHQLGSRAHARSLVAYLPSHLVDEAVHQVDVAMFFLQRVRQHNVAPAAKPSGPVRQRRASVH